MFKLEPFKYWAELIATRRFVLRRLKWVSPNATDEPPALWYELESEPSAWLLWRGWGGCKCGFEFAGKFSCEGGWEACECCEWEGTVEEFKVLGKIGPGFDLWPWSLPEPWEGCGCGCAGAGAAPFSESDSAGWGTIVSGICEGSWEGHLSLR